jgi:hypothetical protein
MAVELVAEQIAPPRTRLDDDKFMAAWPRMAPEIKRECLRMEREIQEGIAILKDRSAGRPKKDLTGFYGLELAEADLYRLEGVPRKEAELEKARKRVAALMVGLAADAAKYARYRAMDLDLDPYFEQAKASGKTLPEVLRGYIAMEQLLREDLVGGVFLICERAGVDPVKLLMGVLNAPDNRQAAH